MNLQNLKNIMKARGMGNKELAEISGVPLGTLNKILYGITKDPSINTMQQIADALSCTLDDFSDFAEQNDALDNETMEIREMLHKQSGLKMLFYAAKDVSEEDLLLAAEMVKRMKKDSE